MNILILGGDGYLGWSAALKFSKDGHKVTVVDNYARRTLAEQTNSAPLLQSYSLTEKSRLAKDFLGLTIEVAILDLSVSENMFQIVRQVKPEAIIHFAEQPSAPYSMRGFSEAQYTLRNNLDVTFNCIWAIMEEVPECHLIKLGTMGEYGTPNIDIKEGWIDIELNGRSDKFLYPRAAGSLYHTTKVLDTDLLWFYTRTHGLRVTDLMQGPVYGISPFEEEIPDVLLPHFHYDDIFGTVINRFLVQAVSNYPLTVYGHGGQTRGYLNLIDTMQCIDLALENPVTEGELRILNQFTETFSVNELAKRVQLAAAAIDIDVKINQLPNPRLEKEDHYYNPENTGFTELGLKPNYMTEPVLERMLRMILKNSDKINRDIIQPRVKWS